MSSTEAIFFDLQQSSVSSPLGFTFQFPPKIRVVFSYPTIQPQVPFTPTAIEALSASSRLTTYPPWESKKHCQYHRESIQCIAALSRLLGQYSSPEEKQEPELATDIHDMLLDSFHDLVHASEPGYEGNGLCNKSSETCIRVDMRLKRQQSTFIPQSRPRAYCRYGFDCSL